MSWRQSTIVEQTMTELTLVLLFVSFAGVVLMSERFENAARRGEATGPDNETESIEEEERLRISGAPSISPCIGPGATLPDEASRRQNAVYLRTNDNLDWLKSIQNSEQSEAATCLQNLCTGAVTWNLMRTERVVIEFTAFASSAWRGGVLPNEVANAEFPEVGAAEGEMQAPNTNETTSNEALCKNAFDCNLALTTDRARNLLAYCEEQVALDDAERAEYRMRTRIVPRGSLNASEGDQQIDRRIEINYVLVSPSDILPVRSQPADTSAD